MRGRARRRATSEKPLVYNMRPQGCQENGRSVNRLAHFPQIIDFKPVSTYTGLMNDRRVVLAVLLLAGLATAWSSPLFAQAIPKGLYVSVVDQARAPVPDVQPADLIVREDDVAREILRIAPADEPMLVAVLVDTSEAAREFIADIRRALPQLVDTLLASGRRNDIAIIGVGGRPVVLADYTRDRALLQKGIDLIWPQADSGNYLLSGIIEVTQGITRREATRPVIIAITTEGPEYSARSEDLVLTPLRDSGAAFHAFVLGPLSNDLGPDAHARAIVLGQGTHDTGGDREIVLASSGLPGRLKRLADELTHQYRVTYARPQTLIPPERVTVGAARPGLTARGTPIRDFQRRR